MVLSSPAFWTLLLGVSSVISNLVRSEKNLIKNIGSGLEY
jgi:hypothetical protein